MSEKKKSQFLENMFKESEAYSSIDMIQSYIENGVDLGGVPLQPLYAALKSLSPDVTAGYLHLMTEEQRVIFQDLDLWRKDNIDTKEFEYWISCYACLSEDNLRFEFAHGAEFLLFLKGRFNIWTFDTEDPVYPDHDYYFLTDDSQLLFEYDETFGQVEEVKILIRDLYSRLGVEKAYSYLFKIVSDGALLLMEDEYRLKKGRLADAGFVDYYDALDLDQTYAVRGQIDNLIRSKKKVEASVNSLGKQQILPKNALTAFKGEALSFDAELAKVAEEKRIQYLRFNFLRLVNGSISLGGSYKAGSLAVTKVGQKLKQFMELGFSYLTDYALDAGLISDDNTQSLFELFDFVDLYRIGHSLIQIELKVLKKSLREHGFEDDDSFLGGYIDEFLDNSFSHSPKLARGVHEKGQELVSYEVYTQWQKQVHFVVSFLPFISQFHKSFNKLKDDGLIQDHFYYNYDVADIDLEAIVISNYANFRLGNLESSNMPKLGLMIEEFKKFCAMEIDDKGSLKSLKETKEAISNFQRSFGLEEVDGFHLYLLSLLEAQLEGYDYKGLEDQDFRHIGGPIIFVGS